MYTYEHEWKTKRRRLIIATVILLQNHAFWRLKWEIYGIGMLIQSYNRTLRHSLPYVCTLNRSTIDANGLNEIQRIELTKMQFLKMHSRYFQPQIFYNIQYLQALV